MWDEMKIRKDLTWVPHKLEWDGVVDYDKQSSDNNLNALADHALVFIFQPYRKAWAQPIARFATKGAASGTTLHELIIKSICCLYNAKAIVRSMVGDGCQSNKALMGLLGIDGGKNGEHSIVHPMNPLINVFYFVDAPHLVKCVQNHIFKHGVVQVFNFYKFL